MSGGQRSKRGRRASTIAYLLPFWKASQDCGMSPRKRYKYPMVIQRDADCETFDHPVCVCFIYACICVFECTSYMRVFVFVCLCACLCMCERASERVWMSVKVPRGTLPWVGVWVLWWEGKTPTPTHRANSQRALPKPGGGERMCVWWREREWAIKLKSFLRKFSFRFSF